MIITIEATQTLTLVVYPELDRVVWIMGIEKKTCTTDLARAVVELESEAMRRRNERKS